MDFEFEKIFKMVAICKPRETEITKEIKLFENIFKNDDVVYFDDKIELNEERAQYVNNLIFKFLISYFEIEFFF